MTKHKRNRAGVPVVIQLLRLGLRSLNTVSPQLAGRWAYHLWFGTHRFAEPKRETQWREQAQEFTLPHKLGRWTCRASRAWLERARHTNGRAG